MNTGRWGVGPGLGTQRAPTANSETRTEEEAGPGSPSADGEAGPRRAEARIRANRVPPSARSVRVPGGARAGPASRPVRRSLALADDAAFRERARMLAALERRRWLNSYVHRMLVLDAR